MDKKHLDFDQMTWEKPAIGVQQKVYVHGKQQLRLLRFEDDFVEHAWCQKGHIGYVLAGEMHIAFEHETKYYKTGDALWIESGEHERHRVKIEVGHFVELLLFETI